MISRRTLLNTAGATAVLAGVPLFRVYAEDAPIKLGCIEDNSGVLDIYGNGSATPSGEFSPISDSPTSRMLMRGSPDRLPAHSDR
jgi:hypothetical protein